MGQNFFQSVSNGNFLNVQAKTHANTGTTLTAANDVIIWSLTNGNNDTVVIPDSTLNAGKVFTVKLANITAGYNTLTMTRTGSDVFGAGVTSLVLFTIDEEYQIVSNGAGVWYILNHSTLTPWSSTYFPFTPNNFGTISQGNFIGRRVGDSLELIFSFKAGTLSAAPATMSLPTGLPDIDILKLPSTQNSLLGHANVTSAAGAAALFASQIGLVVIAENSNLSKVWFSFLNGTTASNTTYATVGATGNFMSNSDSMAGRLTIPITGWMA